MDDFYANAYRTGVAAFENGAYEIAATRLRVAAFGYVDDLPRFEMAQAYIAVAERRLQRPDEAMRALRRIVAAEKIERHFNALQMSAAMRSAILDAAKTLLPAQQAAWLLPPEAQIAAPKP